ncbi:MAG: hypothetical protein M1819_003734 [Sarea resinae]|nr:MAG: hypothetical protein M1819_003734 [Sarea resinae]
MAALDADLNWTVAMAESANATLRRANATEANDAAPASKHTPSDPPREPIPLPTELIIQILSHMPPSRVSQHTFYSCCLVSRQWYSAAVAFLYHRPYITGKNFKQFVATVCPSINAHIRRSELAELVHTLDMGNLVHDGSKSLTARLLGRMKGNLESFTAPQASFAINCFAPLSKCQRLRTLDLSLVSESLSLATLFASISSLPQLTSLTFPRSTLTYPTNPLLRPTWPPALKTLNLVGGISLAVLYDQLDDFPSTLTSLTLTHCPHLTHDAVSTLLARLSPPAHTLTHVSITHPMRALARGDLDNLPLACPHLVSVAVSLDYITRAFFDAELPRIHHHHHHLDHPQLNHHQQQQQQHLPHPSSPSPSNGTTTSRHNNQRTHHPLRSLELHASGDAIDERFGRRVTPNDIYLAVFGGFFADLRRVRVSRAAGWTAGAKLRRDMADLAFLLEQNEEERREERDGSGGSGGRGGGSGSASEDGDTDADGDGDGEEGVGSSCVGGGAGDAGYLDDESVGVWTFDA